MISIFKRIQKTREEATRAQHIAEEKGDMLRAALTANKNAIDRVLLSCSDLDQPIQKLHRA